MNFHNNIKAYTQQNLRSCQLKQLSILEEIDKICKRHNIEYWLDGGSLLGAIRHGGFIPWDDDIDIAMSLEDEKRFEQIAPKSCLNGCSYRHQLQTQAPKSPSPRLETRTPCT